MTIKNTQLKSKRNAVAGTLNQIKGVARERWGHVTNNPKMQLAGKKDQVVGTLQKTVGNSWGYRHKNFLLVAFTTAAALTAAVFYYLNRDNEVTVAAGHYNPLFPRKV
jgi:uncharacterized protein YjbJ (UPF0337 family)